MGAIKVAVVGAGPAGCMLARLLHMGGVDVTVFEGESSSTYRRQGGTLDLHTKTGMAAMREADLFGEFTKYARYESQYLAMVDKDLKYLMERSADNRTMGERPEIDRERLREILIDSLPKDMIHWGHRLQRIEGNTLIFENTTATGFDLIVGADGAWSKVRQSIAPDFKPIYVGVAHHELRIPDGETNAPEMYKFLNRGNVFASNEGQRIVFQQMGDGSISIYVAYVREDADWMKPEKCGYDTTNLDETKKALAEEFKDWCPQVLDALNRTQGPCFARSLHILPIGEKWEHKPGVTLIGDAAHLMTPYAGEGANQALQDSVLLARTIIETTKDGKDLNEKIQKFEEDMRARNEPIQQLSYDLCRDWMFTPGAPRTVMPKAMSRHIKRSAPYVFQPFMIAGVYTWFYFKNLWG